MKIAVFMIGLTCFVLSIIFIGYGIKNGLLNKKMITDHYTSAVTGKKATITGIFYILIGIFFLVGALIVLSSWYIKIKQGLF